MSTIAITKLGETVWQCDRCDATELTTSAFELPEGWYTATTVHRLRRSTVTRKGDYCQKRCLSDGVKYASIGQEETVQDQ